MVSSKDVLGYQRMVAELAIKAWWYYPPSLKTTIDVEDLIQDGLMFARFDLAKSWRPERGKFTTYLYASLPNFYQNQMVVNGVLRESLRVQYKSMSMDSWGDKDIYDDDVCDPLYEHLVRSFEGIYYDASLMLRKSIRRWFLLESKICLHGMQFQRDRKEFLHLLGKYGVNRMDCEIMMNSQRCLDRFTRLLPEGQFIPLEIGV